MALEPTIYNAIINLAASTLCVPSLDLDIDADLFDTPIDGGTPHPEDVREDFHYQLLNIINTPFPSYEIDTIRTTRQAIDMFERYLDNPEKEYQACLRKLDAAIKQNPDDKQFYFWRAHLWEILGDDEKLIKDMSQYLALDPWSQRARAYRQKILLKQDRRPETAMDSWMLFLSRPIKPFLVAALLIQILLLPFLWPRLDIIVTLFVVSGAACALAAPWAKKLHCGLIMKQRRAQREKG